MRLSSDPSVPLACLQLTPTGTTVIRNIKATDRDVDHWYITYEIVPGPFAVRPTQHAPRPVKAGCSQDWLAQHWDNVT